jgi:hypothetical protein
VHLVGFTIKKFVTMHGHVNVKFENFSTFLLFLDGVSFPLFLSETVSYYTELSDSILCCLTRIIHAVVLNLCREVRVKWLLGTMISCIPQGMGLTLYY